ncbi:hypothetical protein H6G81_28295 [Scytonema hofmannii FACHB-248]|uniref:Uncharacterized protein n=1 Tax=Scytonema hofmannii FACHB-248 TaxID=1842502 RepID=A0ABR8GXR7_9CYAN|nr:MULTISPECIES: hypothetical protein [Nostocales]MBD2608312.1 hypothetical protein [Scytonema hofmannii FACHB-248]
MKIHKIPKWVIVSVFVIELFLLISLSLVNYNTALALLLGIIIGLLLAFFPLFKSKYYFLTQKIIRGYNYLSKSQKYKILIIGLFSFSLTLFLFKFNYTLSPDLYSTVIAQRYVINFEPLNKELTKFRTTEELQLKKK